MAGIPRVTSVSEVPIYLAVAGGPAVIGLPAVDGVLAVVSCHDIAVIIAVACGVTAVACIQTVTGILAAGYPCCVNSRGGQPIVFSESDITVR
jgi:hypothetical protein